MKVSTEAQIAQFIQEYPILEKPIEILRRRASGGNNVALRIHIAVKRMDTLMPYFVGNPTKPRAWIPGEGINKGLDGTEEARAYVYWPMAHEPLHFLFEWSPGDAHKLGNLLLGIKPEEIGHVVIETCYVWHERRKDITWESIVGRTPMRAIEATFVVLLPPKSGTVAELFEKAKREHPELKTPKEHVEFLNR